SCLKKIAAVATARQAAATPIATRLFRLGRLPKLVAGRGTAGGVLWTGAVGGGASGETVELPGRSVNPAEECPGTRGTMPSASRISRNTLPHDESSTCRAMTIAKIRFDCSDRPGTATYA